MRPIAAVLAAALTLAPAHGRAAAPAGAQGLVEGPAPGPAPEVPRSKEWLRRERELKSTTWIFVGLAGASLLGLIATSAALARSQPETATYEGLQGGAIFSGAFLGVSMIGGATSFVALRRHRHPPPPEPVEESVEPAVEQWDPYRFPDVIDGKVDPRTVPAWVRRDRQLTRGLIATGSIAGGGVLGMILVGVYGARSQAIENYGATFGMLGCGVLVGLGLVGLAGVGIARAVHRRPLLRWDPLVGPGGLQFRF